MKAQSKKDNKYFDLIFTFKYVNVYCDIDEDLYDKEDIKKIKNIVSTVSKEITIDKSYVDFAENKHDDVFMLEDGWNSLCKLVIDTNFGKKATLSQNTSMQEAYMMMILCYIYLFLENLGYTGDGIFLEISYKSRFMVGYQKDTIQEWKYYPGKWQTWNKYKKK